MTSHGYKKRSYSAVDISDDSEDDEIVALPQKKKYKPQIGAATQFMSVVSTWVKGTSLARFLRSTLNTFGVSETNENMPRRNGHNEVPVIDVDDDNDVISASAPRSRPKRIQVRPDTPISRKKDCFVTLKRKNEKTTNQLKPSGILQEKRTNPFVRSTHSSSREKSSKLKSGQSKYDIKPSYLHPEPKLFSGTALYQQRIQGSRTDYSSLINDSQHVTVRKKNIPAFSQSPIKYTNGDYVPNSNINEPLSSTPYDSTDDIEITAEIPHLLNMPHPSRRRLAILQNGITDSSYISKFPVNGQFSNSSMLEYGKSKAVSKTNNGFTTNEVIRIQEKEDYKNLLNLMAKQHSYKSPTPLSSVPDKKVLPLTKAVKAHGAFFKETVDVTDFVEKFKRTSNFPKYADVPKLQVESNIEQEEEAEFEEEPFVLQVVSKPRELQSIKKKQESLHERIREEKKTKSKELTERMKNSPLCSKIWLDELKKSLEEDRKECIRNAEKQHREVKEYRALRVASYTEFRKNQELKRKGLLIEEDPEQPVLTPEMEEVIKCALVPTPPDEVLSTSSTGSVLRKDMDTLSGLSWLNDEIINYYISLIVERSKMPGFPTVYAFSSFFYPKLSQHGHSGVKRWTRKVDIFSYDIILIPLHLGVHWCLAVIDFRSKKIQFYDSMGGKQKCFDILSTYLVDESRDKKKQLYDMSDWTFEVMKDIPPQLNGSDCGMFTLKYAEYITRNAKINFSQKNMPYFRLRMVYEIMTRKLL